MWAVSWLMISALLGVLLMPMTAATAGSHDGVTLVTVCTDTGPRQVALDDEGNSVPLETAHHHGCFCPFCLSHSAAAPPPLPAALSMLPVDSGREIGIPVPVGIFPEAVFLTDRQSRAPPTADA